MDTTIDPTTRIRIEERLVNAVDAARSAVELSGEGGVGAHRAATVEGECTATHYFDADLPGYRGWVWCVVLAACPSDVPDDADSDAVTVSEMALLPGDGALTAPRWVPWAQRVAPGDLTPGDVLAADVDDPRLVPNQIDSAELTPEQGRDEFAHVALELGLGRARVLSHDGRDDAATRWYRGEFGPDSEMAHVSRFACGTCGFYVPLTGGLRPAFGACANEFAADGRVVSAAYGCGAHSDAQLPTGAGSPAYDAYDDGAIEIVATEAVASPN